MSGINKSITAINTYVNYGARLDWNGMAFDLNVPDDTVDSIGITARSIVCRYFL